MSDGDTIVTVVRPEYDFEENFERILIEYDSDSWTRSNVYETEFIKRGIQIIHRSFGKPGRRKVRSAMTKFGLDNFYNRSENDLQLLDDHYDSLLNSQSGFADSILTQQLEKSYFRDTVGSEGKPYLLPNEELGRLKDLADLLGFSQSELVRHLMAISIAHADCVDGPTEVAQTYEDGLLHHTRVVRGGFVKAAIEQMEDRGEL